MSDILGFWASRLGGRTELDRNAVVDAVLGWGRDHGAQLFWIGPILALTEVRFYTAKTYQVVRYVRKLLVIGGIVELPLECVTPQGVVGESHMGSAVHELWHAYVDSFVEKEAGAGLDHEISDLFGAVVASLRGRVPDASLREAADELVGNYLGSCVDCLKLHVANATTKDMAQRLWADLGSEDRRTFDLTGRDYPRINATLSISDDAARRVRTTLLGLGDDVGAWPRSARKWEVAT
jgi:hypothetical protein